MTLSIRVIAPTGRDAALIIEVLQQHGIPAQAGTIASFLTDASSDTPLGPLLIAEEALNQDSIHALASFVEGQPSWSDLPILILTGNGRETPQSARLQAERLPLGSPVLLERPIRTATLLSSVQAALRARTRQYEIRTAVAELKAERELLTAMLDNLPVGVILANASGEIVRGNRQVEDIVRHPLLRSATFEDHGEWVAYHPDGRRVAGEEFPLVRAMRAGHPLPPEEYLYERGDGTRAWVSLSAAPILSDSGEVMGGVVAMTDIDRQKKGEAALNQNEKLAAVGRLAASISHEINNPLEAVTNLLYLARQSQSDPDSIKGFLDSADQELSRVSQIVSHTLRFHRQSTKPRVLTPEELLAPTLGLYAGRLVNSNISMISQQRGSDLISCYEGEIRQVINNFVGNAIDAMKLGGRLIIRTSRAYSWKKGSTGVRITIADTGHGIPADAVGRIFEAFYTTKGINGTGLGLWISRGIAEKHDGFIQVRTKVGVEASGTVFSLFLPIASQA